MFTQQDQNLNTLKTKGTSDLKYSVKTYGCQMNIHDSERIGSLLSDQGFQNTDETKNADLVVINTCHVREKAYHKFRSLLGELKRDKLIGVAGCSAQVEGENLIKEFPQINFIVGTDQIDAIPEVIYELKNGSKQVVRLKQQDRKDNYSIETKITHGDPMAYINIMKGCNHFCTYCIVPFTRGREKSRPMKEVVDDVKRLVEKKGIRMVTLLGQNVNSFGKYNNESFVELLRNLNDINGLELIRYTTSHPIDFSEDLIAAYGELSKLERYLHLPVQAGSNETLKKMKREYTIENYLQLVKKFKNLYPDIALSTDIIVGFCGETDENFEDTMRLVEEVRYSQMFSFKYSPRSGTRADRHFEDDVPESVKDERLQRLQKRQLEIQSEDNQTLIGKELNAWVENKGESKTDSVALRTSCNRKAHVKTVRKFKEGEFAKIKVTAATATSLRADFL